MSELKDIKSLTSQELSQELKALGLPAFRADQTFKWLHEKSVTSFDEMLNLPKNIREKLSELYYISVATIEKKQISCYDGTIKY
ncbi:MAG: 23S rRNA (adenine(2503)-C(2))-methyltransferase RlmN, partial [Acutalibacteraceae bacterium]|nr:23S rRNA (adenine(2503)-C(2))-methyltransferase RlmN [Acutalibacteraceae bacterium]